MTGEIKHAIRFTVPQSRREFVWPARHYASSLTGTQYPRMGERFRLKASFDITPFPADVQVILRAMKTYGIILADNGSAWYISGTPDERWNNDNLRTLGQLLGSNFEAVDVTGLMIDSNSGAAKQQGTSVAVTPASATVRTNRVKTFIATVTGAANTVTWSVNGVNGGDTTIGTVDVNGAYVAPATVPSPATVTVRATSTESPSATGNATVTVIPLPQITSVNPASIPIGSFTLTVDGAGFTAGSVVSFDGAALPTTVSSSTRLTATGSASTAKTGVPVVVNTTDGEVSNTYAVAVTAPTAAVTVTVSPATASVKIRGTLQFTATVNNASNTAVTWKVNGIAGGNTTVGTISSSGLYVAPNSIPRPATVTVSATSAADTTKTASASVSIKKK